MPNELLVKHGSNKQFCFRDSTDFNPTVANDLRSGTPTYVQFDLTSLGNGNYRQSAKFTFPDPWPDKYVLRGAVEMAATPSAGESLMAFIAFSRSGIAATGNPGGASGSDAAYTGYSSDADDSIIQMWEVGAFPMAARGTTTVQTCNSIGVFPVLAPYASLILRNDSGIGFHTDADEHHFVIEPLIPEIQS